MQSTWDHFISGLKADPDGTHHLCDACPEERILNVQREIGNLPEILAEMVRRFNGAELFVNAIPLVTLFGISPLRAVSQIDWPSEWYIDKYTRLWRASNPRSDEWAFAMTNYGGLMLVNHGEQVREWDTNASRWVGPSSSIDDWQKNVLVEGHAYMSNST